MKGGRSPVSNRLRDAQVKYRPRNRDNSSNGREHPVGSSHDTRCHSRYTPANQLDDLVWNDLCEVVQHPELITQALERAHSGDWLPEELQHRQATLQKALTSLERQRERLLTAYLAGAIELAEFERRQRELVQQREALLVQDRHLAHYSEQLLQVRDTIPTIEAICQRLQIGLDHATFEQRRQLVELLIDCVIVTGEEVEIRYVIPTTEASTHIRFCHLRKDYFDRPHLVLPSLSLLRCHMYHVCRPIFRVTSGVSSRNICTFPYPFRCVTVPSGEISHLSSARFPLPSGSTSRFFLSRVSQCQPRLRTSFKFSKLLYQLSKATRRGAKPLALAA